MNNDIISKYLAYNYNNYVFLLNSLHKTDFSQIIQNSLKINQLNQCEKFLMSNKEKKITIQNVREMINFISKTSFSTNYKVVIFEEIEKTDLISLNILLKLLEDLPNKVIFFITTNNIYFLPKTLRSRCFPIMIEEHKSEKYLENNNLINLFKEREFISEQDWSKITEAIYQFFINLLTKFLYTSKENNININGILIKNDILYYLDLMNDLEKKINEVKIFHYDKKTILNYFLNSINYR